MYPLSPDLYTCPQINPPLAGDGGGEGSDLSQKLKNEGGYRPETYGTVFSINLVSSSEISAKFVQIFFLENDVLMTLCHSILGRKSVTIQMLLECRVLK